MAGRRCGRDATWVIAGLPMRFSPNVLSPREENALSSTIAFLKNRLARKETIEWAVKLAADEIVKRQAVLHWLDRDEGVNLREPWRSAWRIIEESWREPSRTNDFWDKRVIRDRLQAGDRSDTLVSAIVDLVAPRIIVEPHQHWARQFYNFPKRPRTFHDIFHPRLTSGKVMNPRFLKLEELTERRFLVSLANRLDAAFVRGLDIASRIGREGQDHLSLQRVYYASECESDDDMHEADAHQQGIAPTVKLLYAVTSRLIDVDPSAAHGLINRWKQSDSPIPLRLWAAISRDPRITPAGEVGEFLLNLDQSMFWDVRYYPEIAELRARRFADLSDATQKAMAKRIRKGITRPFWHKETRSQFIAETRLKWIVREFRRIEIAGGILTNQHKTWLDSCVQRFPELALMDRIDEKRTVNVRDISPKPDHSLDFLKGLSRLRALERALSSPSNGLGDDPAGKAYAWMREEDRPILVLGDIESTGNGGADFPRVWEKFGWVHSPPAEQERKTKEAGRVLRLLTGLPEDILSTAIGGIAYWLYSWRKDVVADPIWSEIWIRVWPFAVEQTNADHLPDSEPELNIEVWFGTDEREELDTLNPPTGKVIDIFLAACPPDLTQSPEPFDHSEELRAVRDRIVNASGRSGLIGKHRLIEVIGYFLSADEKWTQEHLIRPLRAGDEDSLALWRAVSLGRQSEEVLRIIGDDMTARANDRRLSRNTRCALAFCLVVETLHALREQRKPAVESNRVQQMMRTLGDPEVRVSCANAVKQFLLQMSSPANKEPGAPSREELFRSVIKPFLENVWPQERSLSTPGLSHMLAQLPALAGCSFAEAVDTVERFLTPFSCWTMSDYQLHGMANGIPRLAIIADDASAAALLRLLDRTVDREPDAVAPHDLGEALAQVREVAAHLVQLPSYRRLEAAARRARW